MSRIPAALLLALMVSSAAAQPMQCLVVGVIDGDTINARCGSPGAFEQIKVRLGAIDAPEQRQAFGQRSKQELSDLVYLQMVDFYCYKRDRYQRHICLVSTKATGDVGLEMVRKGMAWWYRDYASEQPREALQFYEQAEQQAIQARRGLWIDPHAIPPWEWRKSQRNVK